MSPGVNGSKGPPLSSPFTALDPSVMIDYLTSLLEITLGATKRQLEAPGSLLSKAKYADTIQRCIRFASESQVVLYIVKDLAFEESNGVDYGSGMYSLELTAAEYTHKHSIRG